MRLLSWKAPGGSKELMVCTGPEAGAPCLLVLPAWFDEGNKTRQFTVEVMRLLAARGIACALPDLPGCNESPAPLEAQTLASWRKAAAAAARQMKASHVLAMRGAATIAPAKPGWAYAPLAGKSALRNLLRARVLAAKEAGHNETTEALLARGKAEGLDLAGYRLGAQMVSELAEADASLGKLAEVAQASMGGPGLWLRAEPGHDPVQAEALAGLVSRALAP